MNIKLFNQLMKRPGLKQEITEWKIFLEFCSVWLKKQKIKKPIVVELGILNNNQKAFYEQLFNAEHIGIDVFDDRGKPDVLGDTHDVKTFKMLKRKLGNRLIDILFIDASHFYDDARKDFEIYQPLCTGLVVLHGTETYRNTKRKSSQVWKLWDDLKQIYPEFPFISIFKRRKRGNQRGIGIIVKK